MAKNTHVTGRNQHVIPLGNGWAVKAENNNKLFVITEKQTDAIQVARGLAKTNGSELVIHARTGQVRERTSYAESPTTGVARKKAK